ncbi:hypothetical protein CI109_103649 [Kwoniella shandongensis]|uniref:Uncharacterized protein n=1 Tax=Kwoniella shandongensis TaxID=1734106 RepID=A0A5M6C7J0_9TREE|nr:uncharacterized protein CI109_000658 [Kwoniella shandongensis]KAA5531086.1 hypothetical protein CI109_000658 [Kwoniella shandongensis]
MPSLADSLDALRQQSEQIAYLSTLNSAPPGPFVQAYLHLPSHPSLPKGNVLQLIRDAQDSERRLFKFVGESDTAAGSGAGGGNKRVEKREGGVVTPLKELRKGRSTAGVGGGGKDETEVMLRTAMKLVDDYRPMPRARAHVTNLLDTHHRQAERLAELEQLIAEATKPTPARPSAPTSAPTTSDNTSQTPKPKLTPEEAIKAEEAALRAIEARLAPLRRNETSSQASQSGSAVSPSRQSPSRSNPNDQAFPSSSASTIPDNMRTPAREMPHVTNSLVNGTTPRRIDRFSPLRFLGTPRAPVGASGLRNATGTGPEEGRRTIFGRTGLGRSTSGTGSQKIAPTPTSANTLAAQTPVSTHTTHPEREENDGDEEEQAGGRATEDETIRLARPVSPSPSPVKATPAVASTPERPAPADVAPDVTPRAEEAEQTNGKNVDGVDVNAEGVKAGVEKLWNTLGEMMRQGLSEGKVVGQDVESTVAHLQHISQSNLPPPPSPSNASSHSSLSSAPSSVPPAKPLTPETILFAHLFLILLRASSTAEAGEVDMNEVKETLGSVAKARGWDGAGGLATKVIYAAVGKRTVRIDRKGGGSGRVKFAE